VPDELLKSSKVVAPSADVVRVETAAEFGRVLRRRRKELGHTQAEVAALCHVGVRFLSELERGKATAELGRALKVARRLGLELQLAPRSPVPPQWPAK
jgi:transcriptional regulator with XRE-family HTH domain